MERSLGFKLGIILIIISFLYISQTSWKMFPVIVLDNYLDGFTMPLSVGGVDLVLTSWILFAAGILAFILAVFDLPPFNF